MINIKEIQVATEDVCRAINGLLPELSGEARPISVGELEEVVQAAHTHLFLVYDAMGGGVVGMFTLAAYRLTTGWRVWLEDVVLSRVCRGRGFGSILVEHAMLHAQILYPGGRLMLTSRPERVAANRIYSSLFSRKETNVYVKEL